MLDPNSKEAKKRWNTSQRRLLLNAFIKARTSGELKMLIELIFTEKEIDKISRKLNAAKLITGGAPYRDILRLADISQPVIARLARKLDYGDDLHRFLRMIDSKPHIPRVMTPEESRTWWAVRRPNPS